MDAEQLILAVAPTYSAIFSGVLAALLVLESLVPLDPIESEARRARHVVRNFALWVVAVLFAHGLIGVELLRVPERLFGAPSGSIFGVSMPFLPWLAMGVLILDLGQFVFHRLTHLQPWLWSIHAVHHSDDAVDVSTSLRFHPLELALGLTWKVGLLTAVGLPLWLIAARSFVLMPLVLLQHANVRIPAAVERPMRWIFVTPGLHKIHHSPRAAGNDSNFGEIFSFWDRILGTLCELSPAGSKPYGLIGLRGGRGQSVIAMLAAPVLSRRFPR